MPSHFSAKRKQAFVDNYLATRNGTETAKTIGLKGKYVGNQASNLRRDPDVSKAINEATKLSPTAAAYTLEKAMQNAKEACDFAIETNNANALVRAQELMAKLAGLIDSDKNKQMMLGAGFQVVLMGFRGHQAPEQIPAGEVIDVTHQIAPPAEEEFQIDPDVDPFGD